MGILRTVLTASLLLLAVQNSIARAAVPNPLDILVMPIFPWVVAGAFGGYFLNFRHANYEGSRPLLERYGYGHAPGWVFLIVDLLFFVGFGPTIVTAAYAPEALFQGLTLDLSWPFVIRGAMATAETRRVSDE